MDKRIVTGLVIAGLLVAVLIPRLFDLDAVRSPDEKRWIANTSGFVTKFAHGQLDRLVQLPHPGITTQWLGALTIRADDWAVKKLPLVIGQGLLIMLIGYIFWRRWGPWTGGLAIALLATNPFLFAHSRVYAMDSLLALFLLLSIAALLLWHKERQMRYLALAGVAGAAALLSKLPGVIIVPFTGLVLIYWAWRHKWGVRPFMRTSVTWLAAFVIGLVLILPSIAFAPLGVYGDFAELFRSDEYLSAHAAPATYYLGSLLFFSTPAQMLLLINGIGALAWHRRAAKGSNLDRTAIVVFLLFAVLFTVQMMIGLKKGDRYVLPSFLFLDATAAISLGWLITLKTKAMWRSAALVLVTVAIIWQAGIILTDYQHQLAYVNPLTRSLFGERRHGWGEGLDLAAKYLNNKPHAESLTAATVWPNEFESKFVGQAINAHQHDNGSADYVIIYRSMLARGPDAWETDLVTYYQQFTPEHIIRLSGIEMAWIYNRSSIPTD